MQNSTQAIVRITEIFFSIQGESTFAGLPTIFIRLTGCPLRCHYCDTSYAFNKGEMLDFATIQRKIAAFDTRYITVTGGEPLAQAACVPLLKQLCDLNYQVSLETSGAVSVAEVDSRVIKVLDIKTPGSGMHLRNDFNNIQYLAAKDQLKFVICNRADYEWSKAILAQHGLNERYAILFSPSHQELKPHILAEWILQDQLNVRLQIQLHKYLWGDVAGR